MSPSNSQFKAGQVRAELRRLADPAKAKGVAAFFKTGPGQYGEGDVFLGITVPEQRAVAKRFAGMPLVEIQKLLRSKIHEERLTALILLVSAYERGGEAERGRVFRLYLKNLKWVNNWDLVDASAPTIVGAWLQDKDRGLFTKLARSKKLWERRVAMVACHHSIRAGEHAQAFAIARMLLKDEHDLMHKAVGWMLREVGKRAGEAKLRGFLKKNAALMPRTALRYAIERFGQAERRRWITSSSRRKRPRSGP